MALVLCSFARFERKEGFRVGVRGAQHVVAGLCVLAVRPHFHCPPRSIYSFGERGKEERTTSPVACGTLRICRNCVW